MTLKPIHLAACAALGTAASLFTTEDVQASCNPDQSYVGDICITAATYCPAGTAKANGMKLSVEQYPALFSVLGTSYGGDGATYFNLPNLIMRAPVGAGYYEPEPYEGGHQANKVGVYLGKLSYNQTAEQLAYHTHQVTLPGDEVDTGAPAAPTAQPASPSPSAEQGGGSADTTTVTTGPAGMGADTYVVGPRLTVNYCVVVAGKYPPRNE